MAGPTIRLNRAGIAKILKSNEFAGLCNGVAREVAAQAGDDAEVSEYTTDRRAASVSVPADQQARDGVLTRAAAAVGLTVRSG